MRIVAIVIVLMWLSAIPCAHARNHHFYPPPQSTAGYVPQQSSWGGPGSGSGASSPTAIKKATVWEAPTNDEVRYKSELEASQLQNGLTHPQTMKAMWQLGQYYMNAQKYSEASQTLSDLRDVAAKNKSNCPLPMEQVNVAYNKAQTEMRKEQTASVGRGSSYTQPRGPYGGRHSGYGQSRGAYSPQSRHRHHHRFPRPYQP
jgi:hypothetical protein